VDLLELLRVADAEGVGQRRGQQRERPLGVAQVQQDLREADPDGDPDHHRTLGVGLLHDLQGPRERPDLLLDAPLEALPDGSAVEDQRREQRVGARVDDLGGALEVGERLGLGAEVALGGTGVDEPGAPVPEVDPGIDARRLVAVLRRDVEPVQGARHQVVGRHRVLAEQGARAALDGTQARSVEHRQRAAGDGGGRGAGHWGRGERGARHRGRTDPASATLARPGTVGVDLGVQRSLQGGQDGLLDPAADERHLGGHHAADDLDGARAVGTDDRGGDGRHRRTVDGETDLAPAGPSASASGCQVVVSTSVIRSPVSLRAKSGKRSVGMTRRTTVRRPSTWTSCSTAPVRRQSASR
jgi:hypothetical protein